MTQVMQHSCKTMDMSPVLLLMACFRTKSLLLTKMLELCLNKEFHNLEMGTGMTVKNM